MGVPIFFSFLITNVQFTMTIVGSAATATATATATPPPIPAHEDPELNSKKKSYRPTSTWHLAPPTHNLIDRIRRLDLGPAEMYEPKGEGKSKNKKNLTC